MANDPHQSILNIIGGQYFERWPEQEQRIVLYTAEFTYDQRITALTFLYGNLRDADLVYAAVQMQLGVDPRDHDHAQRFLADLASGRYDQKYHYFKCSLPTGSSSTAHSTRAAHRPARSRACCSRGSANARVCDARRGAGRR